MAQMQAQAKRLSSDFDEERKRLEEEWEERLGRVNDSLDRERSRTADTTTRVTDLERVLGEVREALRRVGKGPLPAWADDPKLTPGLVDHVFNAVSANHAAALEAAAEDTEAATQRAAETASLKHAREVAGLNTRLAEADRLVKARDEEIAALRAVSNTGVLGGGGGGGLAGSGAMMASQGGPLGLSSFNNTYGGPPVGMVRRASFGSSDSLSGLAAGSAPSRQDLWVAMQEKNRLDEQIRGKKAELEAQTRAMEGTLARLTTDVRQKETDLETIRAKIGERSRALARLEEKIDARQNGWVAETTRARESALDIERSVSASATEARRLDDEVLRRRALLRELDEAASRKAEEAERAERETAAAAALASKRLADAEAALREAEATLRSTEAEAEERRRDLASLADRHRKEAASTSAALEAANARLIAKEREVATLEARAEAEARTLRSKVPSLF